MNEFFIVTCQDSTFRKGEQTSDLDSRLISDVTHLAFVFLSGLPTPPGYKRESTRGIVHKLSNSSKYPGSRLNIYTAWRHAPFITEIISIRPR